MVAFFLLFISQSINYLQSYQASFEKSHSRPRVGLQSTVYLELRSRNALVVSYTPDTTLLPSITQRTPITHLIFSNHNWLLNASNTLNSNQPCRPAHLTAPMARARVPTHPVPRHLPHVRCQLLSDHLKGMTLTILQPTLPPHPACTQTPVAHHAANHTRTRQSFTMEVERSTTRTRRRPRQTVDTTTRRGGGLLVA